MDRMIVYNGALPQDSDILNTNLFGMVSEAYQNFATIGQSGTFVAGLGCVPTVPASLSVTVNVGCIFQIDPTDAAAYGSLGTNNSNIMKMGILPAAVSLGPITPPGTVGFSQVFLVQAILNDVDSGATVLSYFNSGNENQPFSGPANSGISQNTQRLCRAVIALKAGVAATTGTQTTPTPDSGYVGLFAITVANGASSITGGNIVQLTTAPFFPTLPQVPPGVQGGNWVYVGTDTGAANAYVISFGANQPIPTAYTAGMGIKFKAANANTTSSTINVNGLGLVAIRRASGVALASGDISSGQIVELTYDGTNFQMQNYIGSGSITNTNTAVNIPYIADTGAQNAIIATFSPAITGGQQVAGLVVAVKLAFAITGACTINVNGLGLKAVKLGDLTNPPFNVFVANQVIMLEYDGTQYQIVNTSSSMFYVKPTSNYTIFVNTSTGNDSTFDGTSSTVGTGTAGPFKTIQKALNVAFGYAPSQFTITISIAAGTYNEAVSTPLTAGPAVTIDGGSPGTTTVNSGNAHSIVVQGPNTMTVKNITVQNTPGGSLWGGFCAFSGATMTCVNTASNTLAGGAFYANAGTVNPGNHTFNGSCGALYAAGSAGNIEMSTLTHTISAPISVSQASAYAVLGGIVATSAAGPITFVNAGFVSGQKFLAGSNGIVNAQSLGINYFPGGVAGGTNFGGQYIP